jgi:radical SAM/Cys-rich protein
VGKLCNQACHHCHVEAGPKRTEIMIRSTSDRVIQLLRQSAGIETIDITGGAPELNPNFQDLVEHSRRLGRHVIDRCNLTILLEPGFENLGSFLAKNEVELIVSLPCYTAENVDKQRGRGVFRKSIEALRYLNRLGYGRTDVLSLNLVYNPLGPSLPPPQARLEAEYKQHLRDDFGIEFNSLFTITNMPIRRFSEQLIRIGKQEAYQDLLRQSFNPGTVEHLMCRSQISVGWDGKLYDCDFNQMLELRMMNRPTLWDIDSFDSVASQTIVMGAHCFGCTAGSGSSCGGTLA